MVLAVDLSLDALQGDRLADVQVDELVGHDAQALQGEGLHLGAGEALDEPRVVGGFVLGDLGLDELNHDLVVNCNRW